MYPPYWVSSKEGTFHLGSPLFYALNRPIIFASGTISLSIESLEKVAYNRGELYVKEIHIVKGALL